MEKSPINWSLDFSPKTQPSELMPVCIWNGFALNHFQFKDSDEKLFTRDVGNLPLDQALLQLYPKLSFAEMTRLMDRIKDAAAEAEANKVAKAFGFAMDKRLMQALDIFKQLSPEFQKWADDHDLSPRDVLPLAALEGIPHQALNAIASNNLSRSYACLIIELIVDCLLLKHNEDELLPPPVKENLGTAWVDKLKELRFAETNKKDDEKKRRWARLPWTKDFQTKWFRRGDQSGMEVRFTISSKSDFDRKMQSLERILDECNDKEL